MLNFIKDGNGQEVVSVRDFLNKLEYKGKTGTIMKRFRGQKNAPIIAATDRAEIYFTGESVRHYLNYTAGTNFSKKQDLAALIVKQIKLDEVAERLHKKATLKKAENTRLQNRNWFQRLADWLR